MLFRHNIDGEEAEHVALWISSFAKEALVAANKKSRKGTSKSSTSASSRVHAWSIEGQVFVAATRREALKMRAEELGLG